MMATTISGPRAPRGVALTAGSLAIGSGALMVVGGVWLMSRVGGAAAMQMTATVALVAGVASCVLGALALRPRASVLLVLGVMFTGLSVFAGMGLGHGGVPGVIHFAIDVVTCVFCWLGWSQARAWEAVIHPDPEAL